MKYKPDFYSVRSLEYDANNDLTGIANNIFNDKDKLIAFLTKLRMLDIQYNCYIHEYSRAHQRYEKHRIGNENIHSRL